MGKYGYIFMGVLLAVLSSCGGAKLSVANEQYERGEYYDAANTYKKVYNKLTKREERELRGEVAFQLGQCYRVLNMTARASAAYQNALRYEYPDSMAHLYLGRELQNEGKYAAAIKSYQDFLTFVPDNKLAKEGIRGCEIAQKMKENPTRYVVKNAKLFNSRRADFAPMFHGDDELYFTSSTEKATGSNKSEITGTKKSDIFFSKKNERGEWQRPDPIEGEVNTEFDEGIISFSPDGNTMYLSKARRELNANTSVEIYTSQRSDAKWSAPVKYEITADTLSVYGHPAVSADGNYLYFSSDMPGGQGGKDIWRVSLKERAGSLENMGEQINSAGNETFPYCRKDDVIYFASDGHAGMGGTDIFKAVQSESGHWNVENMGIPINSSGDDFGITFASKGEQGFFSSNRNDARGYDHIYSFELPEIKVWISGNVLDKDEEPVPNAIIRIVGNDGSNQKEIGRQDGTFKFTLDRGVRYVMLAGARGYLNAKQEFVSDIAEEDAEYNVDFILASINKPQVIENIFYDYDKASLRPESKAALDEMAQVLRDNPNVAIEMASHTDRIASDEYNNALSQRRAKSVVDYLISQGVKADRLQPQGYGKTRPKTITKKLAREHPQFKEGDLLNEEYISKLSPEDQAEADQINRRTEFKVLTITYNMY